MSKNNFVDIKMNGKLFPSWVLMNFKKYKLPEVFIKEGDDPCAQKTKLEVRKYQEFIGEFLSYKSNFKDMLIYHGLGSGKTVSVINMYNVLYNYTPNWNVFLLIKASLHDDPWVKDLNNWLSRKENQMKNIYFIHYDAPNADKTFLETIKKSDSNNQNIFIFEEAHNFIRNVYNNISTQHGKRAQVIYDYIQQEKRENKTTRIVLISGTPAVNNPYEIALIYNLMRPDVFPDNEVDFNSLFIDPSDQTLSRENKNMFQRRILGLTSYYIGATPDYYADKKVLYKNIVMTDYFKELYEVLEQEEERKQLQMLRFNKGKVGDTMSTYASYTRQASNFVFPQIDDKINGKNRPRPSKMKLDLQDANIIDEGKDEKKISKILENHNAKEYYKVTRKFIEATIDYFNDLNSKDEKRGYTLRDDIKEFKKEMNIKKFLKVERKSSLFKELYKCSPKMINIILNIKKSKGPTMVYSNYVDMEGLEMFKIYMNLFGMADLTNDKEFNVDSDKQLKYDGKRFIEYHGKIDRKIRETNKKIFNLPKNKEGRLVKVILISPAGSEGINLSNVRQVHIMEPYWNEVRIEQIIGRAIRQCSHKDLPMEERKVRVYRYKMVRKTGKDTIDVIMENLSRKKQNLIMSFLDAMKEAAVDCELFKNHNMMGTEYKCFKFHEASLLQDEIGPAYKEDYELDKKMDNGSFAIGYQIMKIKVRKIKGVTKIKDNVYSEPQEFWYYKKTGVVYDYDLHFPIGYVIKTIDDIPQKFDDEYYIVDSKI